MCICVKIKEDLYENNAKSIQYHLNINMHKW